MLNSVIAGDRRQKLDAMADGELPRCRYRFPGGTCSMPALAIDETIAHAFAVETAIFASLRYLAHATWMCAFVGFLVGVSSLGAAFSPPSLRFEVQFAENHSSGNILNGHIREITAQVGLQNSNFSFCDLIAVVMVQIENPNRDPKPFNGCFIHHQNHAPAV